MSNESSHDQNFQRRDFIEALATVPVFGFGMSPFGPRIFPSLPSSDIISGVATILSIPVQPPLILSKYSFSPLIFLISFEIGFIFSIKT